MKIKEQESERKKILAELNQDLEKLQGKNEADIKEIRDIQSAIQKIEILPVRFQELKERLRPGQNLNGEDFETVHKALELAVKYFPLHQHNNKLAWEKFATLLAYNKDRLHPEWDSKKALRDAGKILNLVSDKKGKRAVWSPQMGELIKKRWQELVEESDSREKKIAALEKIQKELPYLLSSPDRVARRLREAGLQGIPSPQ